MKKYTKQRLFEVMHRIDPTFKLNEDWSPEEIAAFKKRIGDIEKADDERKKQNILYNKTPDFATSGMYDNPKQYIVTPESRVDSDKDISGNEITVGYGNENTTHKRLSGTYLHGKADDKAGQYGGWDIFGFRGEAPDRNGIYKVVIEYPDGNVQGTLFLWNRSEYKYDDGEITKRYNGLVVMNDDTKAFEDAKKKYNERVPGI